MNTAKKFTTIHLLLNKIDVLEVVIFLALMMITVNISTHTHTVASIFRRFGCCFCLNKPLFSAGTLLFGEVTAYLYVVTCCYLHSTVARLNITESPNAPCLFYFRTRHVIPPNDQPIGWGHFFYLHPRSTPVTDSCCGLIFLVSRFWIGLFKVCMSKCLQSIIIKMVTLAVLLWAFSLGHGVCVTPPVLATCNILYLLFSLIPLHLALWSFR